MRQGVRLGVDVGQARIGVARTDLHGMLATPLETVTRTEQSHHRIIALAQEHDALEIIVGLPLNLRGERTPSTDDAVTFARSLVGHGFDIRLIDERLSTVSAMGQLHASGRRTKGSRDIIDQAAAVVILQHALDTERAQSKPAGTLVLDD